MEDITLIWHDPNINSKENIFYYFTHFKNKNVIRYSTLNDSYNYINLSKNRCIVITSGTNGEFLVEKINNLSNILGIIVFCGNKCIHDKWANKYTKVTKVIDGDFLEVIEEIESIYLNSFINEIHDYNLFISHKQENGGSIALTIKLLLLEKNPNLKIFLDIDDLDNIHNLEENIKNSDNVLLLITDGIFERHYVIKELRAAIKYNKNIIVLWEKDGCKNFPKKEQIPEDLKTILDIKAIHWISESEHRKIVIDKILGKMI